MVRSVVIARAHDGLALAASMDDEDLRGDFPDYKNKTKSLIKSLCVQTDEMVSVEAGHFTFHILLAEDVGYIALCDKSYPKKLTYALLADLQREFHQQFGPMVASAARPYAFIKFDTYIQKVKRSYQDVRAKRNLDRLHEELIDVTKIMTTSINDVLDRGSKLESMSLLSSNLSHESKRYLRSTQKLNLQLLYRKYGPLGACFFIVVLFLYVWYKFL